MQGGVGSWQSLGQGELTSSVELERAERLHLGVETDYRGSADWTGRSWRFCGI